MIAIRHAALSDPGLLHPHNEDRCFAHPQSGLYFVSDGMANDRAPQFILDRLPPLMQEAFARVSALQDADAIETLGLVLGHLNGEVQRSCRGYGATLVLAVIRDCQALLAHLGDSRIYLHRGDRLEPVTRDHSMVQQMLDRGQLTVAEAERLGSNGGPTRFLGMPGKAVPTFRVLDLEPGDRLLLCSDGLTQMLADDDILAILERSSGLEDACRGLVTAANAAGGLDNITVLLVAAEGAA
jgi:protein phosphatase